MWADVTIVTVILGLLIGTIMFVIVKETKYERESDDEDG